MLVLVVVVLACGDGASHGSDGVGQGSDGDGCSRGASGAIVVEILKAFHPRIVSWWFGWLLTSSRSWWFG